MIGATAVLGGLVALASLTSGQRIQTVELANSRYFISNASPYSPQLNWFLAYEYCRTIGMELLTFEKLEETNEIYSFLSSNNFMNSNYWTSGNQLGSEMWIWMSTGQPFNTTFNFWEAGGPPLTKSQQSCMSTEREFWTPQNCMDQNHFICEQTRCFYFNYVTTNRGASQGNTTIPPGVTHTQNRPSVRPIRPVIRPAAQSTVVSTRQEQQQQHQAQQSIQHEQQKPNPNRGNQAVFNRRVGTITGVSSNSSSTPDNETSITQTPLNVMRKPHQDHKVMVTPVTEQDRMLPKIQQQVTDMPLKDVSTGNTSIEAKNNEIIPTDSVSPLQILHPPTEEYATGGPQTQKPTDTTSTGHFSRKETFSWALEDYKP